MANIIKKPNSFYNNFTRKGDKHLQTTHYCPGCGHGILHKLIAEALDELEIKDRTILVSPVGCTVFAYYYFDTGNVQAAHGRAPAVATGVKRTNPESIVITYQGDGDLAAIGGNEILQAANRGENITVFFVNNVIYGMTGGQMAPTTLIGQKTTTSPYGRTVANEGHPIKMAEILACLEAPTYIERVALALPKHIVAARKAVKKALQIQKEKKGFSMVEVLSTCPTGWKMAPTKARDWLIENMLPYYKLGVLKDNYEQREPFVPEEVVYDPQSVLEALKITEETGIKKSAEEKNRFRERRIKIAGFGGQGVLVAGVVLSTTGMYNDLHTTWIPSYGPEMRGGTANCSVIISGNRIGSPLVTNSDILIAMNGPSLDTFEESVEPNGIILINSSIIDREIKRKDVRVIKVPVTQIAADLGLKASANMVALGALLKFDPFLSIDQLKATLPKSLKRKNLVEENINAINKGAEYVEKNYL